MGTKYSGFSELKKQKQRAASYLSEMVKRGKIERKPCIVCGSKKSQGHHTDYSKPLDVVWFCRRHHFDHHLSLKTYHFLSNGNYISEFKITPANLDINKFWVIHYTFFTSNGSVRRQIRGTMNRELDAESRKKAAIKLIRSEFKKLKSGYNPITANKQKR